MKPKSPGRPRFPLDWKKIDQLLEIGCTGTEIAAQQGVSANALYDRCLAEKKKKFSIYAHEKREKGNCSLKEAQFKNATKGNTSMLIWLGKQRLGQSDGDRKNENTFTLQDILKAMKDGSLLGEITQKDTQE